jgi:alpha-galactosidase
MKNTISSLFLLFSIFSCYAQQTIELNNWKFKTGDNINWCKSDFDDSAWKSIKTNEALETQGYPGYDGYGWYRMQFMLPSELNQVGFSDSLRISLGKIDGYDQVFLNGVLIGQNASATSSNTVLEDLASLKNSKWYAAQDYTISVNDARLHWGKINVIAIRVYDSGGDGGMRGVSLITTAKLSDFLIIESSSKLLKVDSDGMIHTTITLKNLSYSTELKGTLKVNAENGFDPKAVSTQSFDVDLKKHEIVPVDFCFKGDKSKWIKATFTFTESKSGATVSVVQSNIPVNNFFSRNFDSL